MSTIRKSPMSTLKLTQLSILIALIAVLTFTPLGFIMIPPISMTILHIPVIIGAILLGPTYGGILGFSFGIMSMIRAIWSGNPGDMLFSPFASGNPLGSIVMCILPRILLGVIVGYLFLLIKKADQKGYIAITVSAIIGTLLHTIMVLGCLWAFFKAFPLQQVFLAIVSLNALLEIASAAIFSVAICKPLFKLNNKTAKQ
ncbi:ECF transporter S component [Paludicola sp. MB14-C6]|uniref:ECF transporter S component n=1 Tax=Paludihabitans sp. MB14-C6 TaxID=3070656 RepID=UPI0027DCA9E9|nr:ECF transporter S component [Paludicola sp. MB14-C6]WMJ22086.1 ECF transporter S component [Paludicola sp. MB14-C6]